MKKLIICLVVFLSACSVEFHDYEIQAAETICQSHNSKLGSVGYGTEIVIKERIKYVICVDMKKYPLNDK